MSRKTAVVVVSIFTSIHLFAQSSNDHFERYIEKYKEIAIVEMQRAGIPASIKLGQALLESDAGRSDLARKANNHFGIKCNTDWNGKTFKKKDDEYDAQGEHIESCFRVYEDAEASFRAHSEFLRNPKKQFRYGQLFELDPSDYKGWAEGLRKAGYATNPSYSKQLIEVIEKYRLYKYDHMTIASNRPNPSNDGDSDSGVGGYMVQNDVKYVLSRDNEPVEEIAKRTHTPVRSLMAYNENLKTGNQRLMKDTKVYLQPKRNSYRGKETYHTVELGETMFEIAQEYGLRLDKLYDRNQMNPGMEPAYNERIKLKGGRVSNRPKLVTEVPQILAPSPVSQKDTVIAANPKPTTPLTKVEPTKNTPIATNETDAAEEGTLPEIVSEKPNGSTSTPVAAKPMVTGVTHSTSAPANEKPSKPTFSTATNEPQNHRDDFDTSDIFTESTTAQPVSKPTDTTQYHTVAKGDTLWNISQRYSTTIDEVKKLNNLNSNNIQLGQRLRIR